MLKKKHNYTCLIVFGSMFLMLGCSHSPDVVKYEVHKFDSKIEPNIFLSNWVIDFYSEQEELVHAANIRVSWSLNDNLKITPYPIEIVYAKSFDSNSIFEIDINSKNSEIGKNIWGDSIRQKTDSLHTEMPVCFGTISYRCDYICSFYIFRIVIGPENTTELSFIDDAQIGPIHLEQKRGQKGSEEGR